MTSSPPKASAGVRVIPDSDEGDFPGWLSGDEPPKRRRVGLSQRAVRILVLAIFWLLAMFITIFAFGSEDVPEATVVKGVDIGGLNREEAVSGLQQTLAANAALPMTVKVVDHTSKIDPADLGLGVDIEATVDSVRTHRLNPFEVTRSLFGGGEQSVVLRIDEDRLNGQIASLAASYDRPVVQPEITYDGTTPQVNNGEMGTLVNREAAAAALAAGYSGIGREVELPVGSQSPAISASDVQSVAAGAAQTAVGQPVTVRVGNVTARAEPEDLAASLSFQLRDGQLRPVVNGAELHARLTDQLKSVDARAVDASWDVSSGAPVVTPSQDGNGVTDDNVASSVAAILDKSGDDRSATLELGPLKPNVTTEDAQGLGITEKISSFTQKFPYAPYRVQNIGLAAKKINKTLLRPGDTFSMNDIVGERTKANGFTKGYVVGEGGRLAEDYGGGVSTATTTVWTAAFYGGLEKQELGAHTIWISRYRPGLEATVAWGQLDLKFRNNSPNGVYITTKMTNESVAVTMWGKKQFDSVKAESGPKANLAPFTVQQDASDACVPQGGVPGFDIKVDRVFFRDGSEVNRESLYTHYIPAAQVSCTGKTTRLS